MVKVFGIILILLNIVVFAGIGLLIYNSNMILSMIGIPHKEEDVEGFSYRNFTMSPHFAKRRTKIQSLGVF